TSAPVPTGRPVLGNTRMRWRRHRKAPMIRRIAKNYAMTDTAFSNTRSCHGSGGNDDKCSNCQRTGKDGCALTQDAVGITKSEADDGKCFVRQRAVIVGCVLAGRQLFVRGSDLSLR